MDVCARVERAAGSGAAGRGGGGGPTRKRRRSSSTASCTCPPRTASWRSSRKPARKSGGTRSPAARRRAAASPTGPAKAARRRASSSRRPPAHRAQRADRRASRRASARTAKSISSCRTTPCRSSTERRRRRREHAAGRTAAPGNPRAFDARTGAKIWEFSSVPQPGEVGHDTWEGDSWKNRAGANAWPFYFTLDEQRGVVCTSRWRRRFPARTAAIARAPICSAIRSSRVDVQTGEYKWHFQTIHHDLWDADPPAPPGLFDIVAERTRDSGARADHQVGLPVSAESRNRRSRSSASKNGRCRRATYRARRRSRRSRSR